MSKISIVTPCYNAERFLSETIQSVKDQTFQDWSYVLVDDGSSDGTVDILRKAAANDSRIQFYRHPANLGASAARNSGAARSNDEYLLFLDSDDLLESQMLEKTLAVMHAFADTSIVYTDHSNVDANGDVVPSIQAEWQWSSYVATRFWLRPQDDLEAVTPFESIFLVAVLLPSKSLIRRQLFVESGQWDVGFGQVCEDTDLFLRLALLGDVRHVPEALVRYRQHPEQSTRQGTFETQYYKLTEKWTRGEFLSSQDQHEIVRAALWFRAHRFYPYRHLTDARAALCRLSLAECARLFATALCEYSPKRPPAPLRGWA